MLWNGRGEWTGDLGMRVGLRMSTMDWRRRTELDHVPHGRDTSAELLQLSF